MISYTLNGAWGKTIPDDKLKKSLLDLGIELEVEARRDGLSNVKINIDEDKILNGQKKAVRKRRTTKTQEDESTKVNEKKESKKKVSKGSVKNKDLSKNDKL